MNFSVARVVLSGSFHRDLRGIKRAYEELVTNTCQVLSPHRLEFDSSEFVRDRAEFDLSIKHIEDHHLLALRQADFMWLYAPNGYVGVSTSFEIGYAKALGLPVFSNQDITDVTLREYVQVVPSVFVAKQLVLNQE